MTRASLNLITSKNIISSTEFNGDGGPNGWGLLYAEILERTKTPEQFVMMIEQFNSLSFKYDRPVIYTEKLSAHFNNNIKKEKVIDLRKIEYSSDWVFYKNITKKLVTIITTDGKLMFLNEGEQIALYYSSGDKYYTSVADCRNQFNISEEQQMSDEVRKAMFGEAVLALAV